VNPDENQPQSEQPNVNPAPAEPNEPASTPAPTADNFQSEPAPMEAPTQQPAPAFAPQQPVAPQPQAHASNGLAIASLVLGIIGFLTGFFGIGILLGLVAVVLGIISLVKHHGGKGMAIAGLILGAIAFVFGGFFFLIALTSYNGVQQKALDNLCTTDPSNVRCK
jgi:hypothetical protein